jgi:hypothetical protein
MELFFDEDIPSGDFRDDSLDYLDLLTWEHEQLAVVKEDKLTIMPHDLDKEEALRLTIMASELQEANEWQVLAMQPLESGARIGAPCHASMDIASPGCTIGPSCTNPDPTDNEDDTTCFVSPQPRPKQILLVIELGRATGDSLTQPGGVDDPKIG